jgi:hypothetical protein
VKSIPFLFEVSLNALLHYLESTTGQKFDPEGSSRGDYMAQAPVDWHLVLRQGLQSRLHINLGIPGVEEPDHPIEENPAALYAAMAMQAESLQVILSGELELAVEAGLIEEADLENLRNKIRVSG